MTSDTRQTQPSPGQAEVLRELIGTAKYVIFDFDGPICRLFAGHPAERVARDQVEWLEKQGRLDVLTEEERERPDPHGVLYAVAARQPQRSDLVVALEALLTQGELKAVPKAMPTAYADPLIRTLAARGTRLAIASNNSARSVEEYLLTRGTLGCFAPHIYGRTSDLRFIKPHPKTLNHALRSLGAEPAATLMIGDMPSDYGAARKAGVRFLGYAPRPAKLGALTDAGVDPLCVIPSLQPLLEVVREL
ncbi:HAD family hydrolase [Streptomyces sp. NPDC008086]|uniref:HAD family hydrolase n=1 Tax=unclassified Streptomyces TaxID=2593676 RepID=UPI00367AD5BF